MTKKEWILMAAAGIDFQNITMVRPIPNGQFIPTRAEFIEVIDMLPKVFQKIEQTADLLDSKNYFDKPTEK